MRFLSWSVPVLLVLGLALTGCNRSKTTTSAQGSAPLPRGAEEPAATLNVGDPAPEIEGEDLDGKKFKLSDYRGKVVFLDFWAHW